MKLDKKYAIIYGIETADLIGILKVKCDDSVIYNNNIEVINFIKLIIEEYQKYGVKIDSKELILSFYVQQITKLQSANNNFTNQIIQTARICNNPQESNSEEDTQIRRWENIEKELKEYNIDVRTIYIASHIYKEQKNEEKDRE